MEVFIIEMFLRELRKAYPEHNIDLSPVIVDFNTFTPTRKVLVNGTLIDHNIDIDSLSKFTPRQLRGYVDLYKEHIRSFYDPLSEQLKIIRKEIYEDPLNIIL